MGRLIDADKLYDSLYYTLQGYTDAIITAGEVFDILERSSTVYDVDKVVEQLEKLKNEKEIGSHKVIVKEAIEIVKAGGVDGNT